MAQSHRSLGGLCPSCPSQAPYLAGLGMPKTLFLDLKGKKDTSQNPSKADLILLIQLQMLPT